MMKIWRVRSPMILLEMTEGLEECPRHFEQDDFQQHDRSDKMTHQTYFSPVVASLCNTFVHQKFATEIVASSVRTLGFCVSEIHGFERKNWWDHLGSFAKECCEYVDHYKWAQSMWLSRFLATGVLLRQTSTFGNQKHQMVSVTQFVLRYIHHSLGVMGTFAVEMKN